MRRRTLLAGAALPVVAALPSPPQASDPHAEWLAERNLWRAKAAAIVTAGLPRAQVLLLEDVRSGYDGEQFDLEDLILTTPATTTEAAAIQLGLMIEMERLDCLQPTEGMEAALLSIQAVFQRLAAGERA